MEARALTISPPVIELSVDPGNVITEEIKIVNTTDEPQIFYLAKADFTASGEGGEPSFLKAEEVPEDYPYSLTAWLKFSDSQIFLPAWEKASVKVIISVPQEASPGGHYGAVFFESRAPELTGETAVGVVSKIGTLILVRVAGKTVEQAKVASFDTQTAGHCFAHKPIKFYTRFENTGNVHLKPSGKIDVYNLVGRVVASLEVNEKGGNVLPGSTRRFEAEWSANQTVSQATGNLFKRFWQGVKNESRGFGFGKYTGYLSLDWGSSGQTANAALEFWIFPWRLTTVVVLGLGLILLVLTVGVKRYNSWILARSASPRSRN